MKERLKKTADSLGLPFGNRNETYNSRLAQELGIWAESKNFGDKFHDAVFRAYFVEGKNIAKMNVLLDLIKYLNLPLEEAREIIETRAFYDKVEDDWKLSRQMGITAVPTFLINNDKMVGAQPYDKMVFFLESNGVMKRDNR